MSHIQLILFDLDGTLIDSRFDLGDAVNYALERMGKPTLSYDELPPLLGSGLDYLLQKATGEDDPSILKRARQLFDEYYSRHHADKTRCYPGVKETLAALPRIKKAVYSNKAQEFTEAIIRKLGLAPCFDKVMGAQPDKYPLKPDPAGIYILLEEMGVPADKALMVGDSTHDIEVGKAAGLQTCAVTYGYRPAEILEKAKPDYKIRAFSDLLELPLSNLNQPNQPILP